jgi:hypothetical protein
MKVEIQKLTEQEEWIDFKTIEGDNVWDIAVKEVFELNSLKEGKYRALFVEGFLTHIYCSGFYMVPTIRFY